MILAAYHRHAPVQHSAVQRAYELIRDADFLALIFAAGLVFYVGLVASARYPRVFQMGKWLGGISFLGYVATAVAFDGYEPLDCLVAYVARGGVVAAIVIGASRLVATIGIWTWDIVMFIPRVLGAQMTAARRRAAAKARQQQEDAERARREEQDRRERDASRRRADEQQTLKNEAARRHATEQRRRSDTRAECELYYSQHVKEIADRFPKSMFDAFMQSYMNDVESAEAVERRGKELQRIIHQHREAAKPTKKFFTVQQLAEWFLQEKDRIESLRIETELRDEQLIHLNIRYAELTQDMLQKMEP